ncbi:MAG TPA: phosphocholine cytidylyltransferase family protein [Chryseolinea sp.]
MSSKVTTAVILAAGLGTRLKHHTEAQPKGFLEIDGTSLIERSIKNLVRAGFNDIIIGTGYRYEHFDLLKKKYPVTTFTNLDYRITGSMYTLYVLRHLISKPFFLLESDLLYDPHALKYLQDDGEENVILASGATQSGDEVYIQASAEGILQQMSKDRSVLTHISGELVGITKLTPITVEKMASYSETHFRNGNRMLNYEDALVGVTAQQPIKVKVIEDLVWCEIDDEHHLNRALTMIYPKIKDK